MTIFDMAKMYYPRLWDKSRLEALVEAGRLMEEEAAEVIDDPAAEDGGSGE